MNKEEVLRRFPEIERIDHDETREQTIHAVAAGHEKGFWEAPAATSYAHHNYYACGKHGLWIHTKMVATAFERLHQTDSFMGRLSSLDVDCGRAACVLHDLQKHGKGGYTGEGAAKDHDIRCAEWLAQNTTLDNRVLEAVASHMGPWYEGPKPRRNNPLDWVVHRADMVASNKHIDCKVYKPADEILEEYPDIPRYD